MTGRILPAKLLLPALGTLLLTFLGLLLLPAAPAQSSPQFEFRMRLAISPPVASIAKGVTIPLKAAHVFSNGRPPADVTRRAIWVSSDPSIASVSNLPGQQGSVTAVNPGSPVTITAISGPERGSMNITVTDPAIMAITITPADYSVAVSGTQAYSATALISDGTTDDITTRVTWSASRCASFLSGSTATGGSPGIATITAFDPLSTVRASTALSVGLSSITVIPSDLSIPLGNSEQFAAVGNFSDGSQHAIAVQWTSSSSLPPVAPISSSGLAQSLIQGTTTITATSGTASGSSLLMVGPPVAKFIAVRPAHDNIGVGANLQFSAAQILTDGSIAPLAGAAWLSSSPLVANINSAGLLTAFSPGTTTITATSTAQPPLVGTATLNVSFTRFAYVSNATDGAVSIYSIGVTGHLRDHGYAFLGANAQPRTPAATPAGAFLYVPESGAATIAGFSIDGSGNLTALPGSPFASGTAPNQVVISPYGAFAYVPNSGSGTISQYSIDGTGALTGMTTVPAGMRPVFLAIDPSGTFLYSADAGGGSVTAYTIDPIVGALRPTATSSSGGGSPQSLAIDPAGSFLLVANSGASGAGSIASFSINPATGVLTPVANSPFNAPGAVSVTIDPLGKYAYSANGSSNTVSAFHIEPSGALTTVGSPIPAPGGPNAVRVDVSGAQLYVVGSQANELSTFSIDPNTGALAASVLRGTRTRNGPYDLALTTGTAVKYVPKFALVSFSNKNVLESFAVDANSGALTSPPLAQASQGHPVTDYSGAVSVAADPSGRFVYVATQASGQIFGYGITPASGVLTSITNSPIVAGPFMEQLAVDSSGRFVYAVNCADTNNVWSYRGQSLGLTSINGAPFSAGSCPFAIGSDPTGRFVYVGNFVDSTISAFAIDPATGTLAPIGSPLITAGRPTGIAVHPSGKFSYVINQPCSCAGNVQVFAVDSLTGGLTGGGTTLTVGANPTALTLDPDGKFLYVVDFGTLAGGGDITAFAVDELTGGLTQITPVTVAPYRVPYSVDGISIDPAGKFLYLTVRGDINNQGHPDEISVFSINPTTGQLNVLPNTITFSPPGQGPSSVVVTGGIQ